MSRKTKRQKIMSSYRRKLQKLSHDTSYHTPPHHEQMIAPSTQKISDTPPPQHSSYDTKYADSDHIETDPTIKNTALHDLKKTGIIITIILLVEFLIYYANLMGIIKI